MLKRLDKLLFLLAILALVATSTMWAQALFATLTGVVSDPSGAVVANAKVTLRNADSGDERTSETSGEGYFTFASVPVGSYNLTVEAPGFQGYKQTGIALGGGERRNVNASLQVGSTNQTVEVTGSADIVTAEDSGEKASVLTTEQLQNYVQVGSNAAEYLKIIPGFGNNNGTSNKSNYSGQIIGINANGDGGSQSPLNNSFSYNGLPGNTLDIVADGAHVSDPGCNCDTPVNPNTDFIQEFRVQSSNFGADQQKGPIVMTTVTKAGGSQFHGGAFFQARNYELNSNDAYYNATGAGKPADKFYYPGGYIGGPVLIPFTKFNKNHDKLFFFTGYEHFFQTIDSGVLTATVPTADERTGNFCPSAVAGEGPLTANSRKPQPVYFDPAKTICQMPASLIDPNMQALMNLYPAPNASGSNFNYSRSLIFDQPNKQWVVRGDWNVSDSTKVFVRYNLQRETQPFPIGLWWRNGDQVPYPTPVNGNNRSDSITGTLTHVFSPTMTNETVFSYTFIGFPNVFADPTKVNPAKVGFNEKLLVSNKATAFQIPSFGAFGPNEAALVFNPAGFEAGGAASGLYANKYMPNLSDTLTKVIGTHTVKAGFFWEWIRNAQPANTNANGQLQFSDGALFSTGNAYADLLEGNLSNFQQDRFSPLHDIAYNTYEGFVQDSWKLTPRLTLELGLRISHFDPWTDRIGNGFAIWNKALYQGQDCANSADGFCGFSWHKKDPKVPVSGFPSRTVFWQPRFGLAYDLFGQGKTVLRGGWGRFYYHPGQFTNGLDTSAGNAGVSISPSNQTGPIFVKNLSTFPAALSASAPGSVSPTNDRQPYTDSWSFTVSQRTPWKGLLELSYVGNSSRDLNTAGGALSNVNLVPVGALFKDPTPGSARADSYRPFQGYGDINVANTGYYSNYNAFQAGWAHQDSRATFQLNYTLGKALGIVNGPGGNNNLGAVQATLDPFNVNNNYGVQPGDRRHIFNASYSYQLPSPIHGNKIAAGAVNGWQISGITQWESGANLTYNSGNENFGFNVQNLTGGQAVVPGTTDPLNNQSIYGTNAITFNPIVTCNPGSGLSGSHQWVNPNCFAVPTTPGQYGSTLLPVVYGPAFFNSDLGIFKNFQIRENMKVQFRVMANNFLNHPLWSMAKGSALNLQFQQQTDGTFKLSNPQFGTAQYKEGQRIITFEAKFYF